MKQRETTRLEELLEKANKILDEALEKARELRILLEVIAES